MTSMARRADTARGERLLREELLLAQSAAGTILEESLTNPLYLIDFYRSAPPGGARAPADVWPPAAETLLKSLQANDRLRAAIGFDEETLAGLAANAPEAVARIRAALAAGRLEVIGGDLLRGLLTLPGGESILRRIARGVAALRESLGVEAASCLAHEDDIFPQLPQILSGFGFQHFIALGGEPAVGRPPAVRLCGPDGSEIATAFATASASLPGADPLGWSNERLEDLRAVVARAPPLVCRLSDAASWDGPVAARVAVAARDDVRFTTPGEYFAVAGPEEALATAAVVEYGVPSGDEALPARTAAQAEKTLLLAESLDALAFAMGRDSDETAIEQAWRDLLHPETAASDAAGAALSTARALAEAAAKFLASYVDSSGIEGRGLVVFNPSSWARDEYMEITLGGEGYRIAQGGREVPSQVIERRDGYVTLGFVAQVPALGYRLLEVGPSAPHDIPPPVMASPTSRFFANQFYSAEIGERGGLSLETAGGRLVDAAGCLTVWKGGRIHDSREGVRTLEADRHGPVLERYVAEGRLAGMRLRQWTAFYRALPRIDLRTEIDFGQGMTLGPERRDGAQDGESPQGLSLELRPVSGGRLFAASPFYVGDAPGAQAVAFGLAGVDDDRQRGIAVLNRDRCSYRFDAGEGVLRALLARPSPGTRLSGTRVWECALLPFTSRLEALRCALNYELPCLGVFVTPHAGNLPPEGSFLSIAPDEALLSAMLVRHGKVYVRLWNASANSVEARVSSGGPLSLWRCSLGLIDEAPLGGTIGIRPWGVQTLRLSGADER
jgi:hypothetical protein